MNCPLLKKRRGKLGGGHSSAILRGGNGADDETTRRITEGDGEEDPLVGCSRDHRGHGPDDAAVAGAAGSRRIFGAGGPAQGEAERQAGATGPGGGSAAAVPGSVFRFEHPALPREAERRARHRVELYLGAEGVAGSGLGGARQTPGKAPETERAAADGGDAAAHRRQQASVVWG